MKIVYRCLKNLNTYVRIFQMETKNILTARIHSRETFGTVDGPGIRFVTFFQGCNLECKYCHNRDTWNINEGKYISVEELFNDVCGIQRRKITDSSFFLIINRFENGDRYGIELN